MCEYIFIYMNLYCTALERPYSNLSKLVKIYSYVKKYDTFPIFTSLLSLTLMDKENILLVYKSLHERMRVARVCVNVYTNI